jgi:hypothetical protein
VDQVTKQRLIAAFRDFVRLDMRPSHLIIGGMILVGAIVNILLPHGWTVWPVVLAFGVLTIINEAVDRNGQGIPPVQVYGFFIGIGIAWLVLVMLMWAINPIFLFLGVAIVLYRGIEAYLKQRERERLINFRRERGVCLHCGEVYDPNSVLCESCGEEPNPDVAVLKRVAQICRSPQDVTRARAVLSRATGSSSAASKEKALIARRHGEKKVSRSNELPKAAKLGPSATNKRRGR